MPNEIKWELPCDRCDITDCKNNCPHGVVGEPLPVDSPLDDMVSRQDALSVVDALRSVLEWTGDDHDYPADRTGENPVAELHWYARRQILVRNAAINALRAWDKAS